MEFIISVLGIVGIYIFVVTTLQIMHLMSSFPSWIDRQITNLVDWWKSGN